MLSLEVQCPSCSRPLTSAQASCQHCGVDLPPEIPKGSASESAASDSNYTKPCPFCAEPILIAAIKCKHCGSNLTGSPSRVSSAADSTSLPRILGMLGGVTLMLGVFLPVVSVPIMGNLNYFQNGKGDGVIVLVLALAGLWMTSRKAFKLLLLPGFGILLMLGYTFVALQSRLSSMRAEMEKSLAGNPFRGIADAAMNGVQIQWGWAVLALGAGLFLAAAIRASRESVNGSTA
jgi:hypothetical protein